MKAIISIGVCEDKWEPGKICATLESADEEESIMLPQFVRQNSDIEALKSQVMDDIDRVFATAKKHLTT